MCTLETAANLTAIGSFQEISNLWKSRIMDLKWKRHIYEITNIFYLDGQEKEVDFISEFLLMVWH